MTVGELKTLLNDLGDHMPIMICTPKGYIHDIEEEIKLFTAPSILARAQGSVFLLQMIGNHDEDDEEEDK